MVKNPPSNAGHMGSIRDQGTKIPRATGQLSLRVTTAEPALSRARAPQQEKPMNCTWRKPKHLNEDQPFSSIRWEQTPLSMCLLTIFSAIAVPPWGSQLGLISKTRFPRASALPPRVGFLPQPHSVVKLPNHIQGSGLPHSHRTGVPAELESHFIWAPRFPPLMPPPKFFHPSSPESLCDP